MPDGRAQELDVDGPIAERGGWLWLHFDLTDTRACQYLNSIPHLPATARTLLVSTDEHQQLQGDDTCICGILADLVCGLDGVAEEIGFLHFAVTEKLFVSSRRHHLSAVEATRHALRRGLKVETPLALLEVIIDDRDRRSICRQACGPSRSCRRKNLGRRCVRRPAGHHQGATHDRSIASSTRDAARNHPALEHDTGQSSNSVLRLQTEKMAQRLNWLDTEIVELRDRSRLLQEAITLKAAEQTNRNLHVLSTVTTIFLPASLVAGIFGMNVAGLPLVQDKSGFLWAMVILVAASVLVYWSLKRWGILRR
jgi:zinc transporter